MTTLKIMPDFGCFPVWILGTEGFFENIDPSRLPISDSLRRQLDHFRERYDQTLNQNYPPESGFSSEKKAIEFEHLGITIWQQLLSEVENLYEITYYSVLDHKLYTDIQSYVEIISNKTDQ